MIPVPPSPHSIPNRSTTGIIDQIIIRLRWGVVCAVACTYRWGNYSCYFLLQYTLQSSALCPINKKKVFPKSNRKLLSKTTNQNSNKLQKESLITYDLLYFKGIPWSYSDKLNYITFLNKEETMFSKAHKIISKIKNSEVRLKWMPSINFYKRTRDIFGEKFNYVQNENYINNFILLRKNIMIREIDLASFLAFN